MWGAYQHSPESLEKFSHYFSTAGTECNPHGGKLPCSFQVFCWWDHPCCRRLSEPQQGMWLQRHHCFLLFAKVKLIHRQQIGQGRHIGFLFILSFYIFSLTKCVLLRTLTVQLAGNTYFVYFQAISRATSL